MSGTNRFPSVSRDPLKRIEGQGRVDRRKFLITSGLGAAGLLLLPGRSAYASPISGAVQVFSVAVGGTVIDSSGVHSFLYRSSVSSSAKGEVRRANKEMAGTGFNDLSDSVVYSPRRESTYFFYMAVSSDNYNACIAVFDDGYSQGSERIGLYEGPTLFAMAELTRRLAELHPVDLVKRVMLPRETIQAGRGSMNVSYPQPDIYRTNEGHVYTDWKAGVNGGGVVTVEAKDVRGKLLAGADLEIRRTA